MSDNLQHLQGSSLSHAPKRPSERQASSCNECRRRKQKCSQGQPCTNCARRFPQPICAYDKNPRRRRGQRVPDGPAAKTVSKEGPYPHLNLSGIQDALLQLESASSSTEFRGDELSPFSNDPFALASLPGDVLGNQQEFVGHVRNWLPFRLDGNSKYDNAAHQLAFGGGGGGPESPFQPRTGNISQPLSREEWMTDTARLVSAVQTSIHPAPSLQKMDQEFSHLPMVPTKLNKELVRTHLRLLSRFKASISGIPNPENPFMKHWIPYIIQDPLLINTVLFTSACFLNETGHLPKSVVVLLRGMVFQSLNNTLRSRESQTSDSAILAVAEMILDEWYWGRTQDLHAHTNGLKTMINMRGGLQHLGMHGYTSKMILIHDICMSLAHEVQPSIYGRPGFEFTDHILVPFQLALNSPLMTGWPSFESSAASLRLHTYTAMILDNARSMFDAVLSLPLDATGGQIQQVMAFVSGILDAIRQLPESVPLYESIRALSSVAGGSSNTGSPSGRNEGESSQSPPGSTKKQDSSPASTVVMERNSPPADVPDPVYRMVRMIATVYCRAILSRSPVSMVCGPSELMQIWGLSWRIPLASRVSILGIYNWTMLTLSPGCHSAAPARFIKSLFVNGMLNSAVDNWHVTLDMADRAFRLQAWLRGSTTSRGMVFGGEGSIEKYGFAIKEVLPHIANVHRADGDIGQGGEDDATGEQ